MKLRKRFVPALIVFAAAVILFAVYAIWANSALTVTSITVKDSNIPKGFDGYKIIHISDLHSHEFGKNNSDLLDAISKAEPDIIVITGDLIDYRYGGTDKVVAFAHSAAEISPTYFVSGNHENDRKDFDSFAELLLGAGVHVLRGDFVTLNREQDHITLIGIDDASVLRSDNITPSREITDTALSDAAALIDGYTILLSHRPDMIDLYEKHGFDLVFSGHAHGGQFRLPFIGGVYAPGQGLFPEYTEGLINFGQTDMIVSRGLGNSGFPLRLFNRPELVIVTLEHEAQ